MQGENERQWKKSEQEQVQHFLHKNVTKKFLEVSRCSRAKQRQRNDQKMIKLDLLLFFTILPRCLCRLALHDFIFCLNKL